MGIVTERVAQGPNVLEVLVVLAMGAGWREGACCCGREEVDECVPAAFGEAAGVFEPVGARDGLSGAA